MPDNDSVVSASADTSSNETVEATDVSDEQTSQDNVSEITEEATGKPAEAVKKPEQPKAPEKKPEPPRKIKIKVDKGEEEYSEEELIKLAQLGRASDKRFQEAAKVRKQAEDFIARLKSDPISVLENPAIGHKMREIAENYLLKELENEQLSPDQRRINELESKLKDQEDRDRQTQEKADQAESEKLQASFVQEYTANFQDALASAGLPRTNATIRSMAKYMKQSLAHGIDRKPADVVHLVRQDYLRDINELLGQSDGDSLLQILGDGIANKIRKADLARLKAGTYKKPVDAPAPDEPMEQPRNPDTKKFMNLHEWREFQASRFKNEK